MISDGHGQGAGGGSGIRTHDTVSRIHAFQASAFSHSAIPPRVAAGNIVEVGGLTTHKHSTDKDLGPGLISARPAVHDPGVMPFCRRALLAAVLVPPPAPSRGRAA
jgi:hypothetical protein